MSLNYSPFISTKKMFREYLVGYSYPLTYEAWIKADEEDKAALLFVNFYNQITLAYSNVVTKYNADYIIAEDAVSNILGVLIKNSTILTEKADGGKRFTQGYFYSVCWGCIFSMVRSVATQKRNEHELSNELVDDDGGVSVNLFDLAPSVDDTYEVRQAKEAIWDIIAHMGPKAEKVVNHLINGDTLKAVRKSSSEYSIDRLADVSVTPSEYEAILNTLQIQLAPFAEFFC